MVALSPADRPVRTLDAEIRRISADDLRWALRKGWSDFREKRGELIILGFIYPVVGLLAAVIAANNSLFPEIFPLVAGLSIVGPAVAAGFYELARRREAGENPGWRCFFEPFVGPYRAAISILSLILAALFIAWLVTAWAIYEATVGAGPAPATAAEFLRAVFTTAEGWTMIVVGNLAGFAFAAIALTLSIVSFPMVVDRGGGPFKALAASVRATAKNPVMVAVWGATVAVILALASIPLFIGLAVALPVLGYATWHLYTRLIER